MVDNFYPSLKNSTFKFFKKREVKKTTNGNENIEKIKEIVEKNGGTAVIKENHNGNGKSEEEKIAERTCMSNIIESIIARIEVKKAEELKEAIAEESAVTVSCNGTKLLIRLNQNGDPEYIKVEAEIITSITRRNLFLTRMSLQNNEKNINSQMIQRALKENSELADACEKLFFSPTIIEFTAN